MNRPEAVRLAIRNHILYLQQRVACRYCFVAPQHARPPDEYKLYGRDVFGTGLQAELVTVSACRSAGAKAYSGEGLIGFAWAFLHAGAKNLIEGLWDVDDGSTPRLIGSHVRGIGVRKRSGSGFAGSQAGVDSLYRELQEALFWGRCRSTGGRLSEHPGPP